MKEQKKLSRKGLYGSKSQKLSKKNEEVSSHEEKKGDFDGTSGLSCVCESEMNSPSQAPVKTERPYRKGKHARAKFVYEYESGGDLDAKYIIDCFGEFYRLEATYKLSELLAKEITRCLQSLLTKEIIGRIRSKLDVLLSATHPPRGELMEKVVNYLQVFWKQLFAYLNDGRYDIDNSIAELFICPLAGERKNSLFFVNSRMENVSVAYHTFLSTCRMNGLPHWNI